MANFVNNTGYLNNSPHRFNPFNIIKSNTITMNNVSIPLLLKPNKGRPIIAMPNSGQYYFPKASHVFETPLFQQGGIYDLMVAHGLDGSYKNRKAIFDKYFKGQYTGSAKQNIQLVKDLNSGKVDFDGNVPMQKSNIPEMLKKPVEIPIKQKTLPFQIIKPTTQPVQNFASTKQTKSSLVNQRQINAGKAGILASTLANQLNKNKTTLTENIGSTEVKKKSITGNADIDYFINRRLQRNNNYMIVDKATGIVYFGNANEHKQTKAGLGKNISADSDNNTKIINLSTIEALEKAGKQKEADALKITLLGSKSMKYNNNIYNTPGYFLGNTGEAIHGIYPIEYKQRKAAITKGNFNVSYGCTNVDQYGKCVDGQTPLNSILSIFGKTQGKDTSDYINSNRSRAFNEKMLSTNKFQPGGSYNDKFGLHVKSLLKNFSNPELYQLSDCPEGYVKDEKGDCIPDTGYNPAQYQQKGMPSVPIKNSNGVTVGGLSTPQPFENKPVDQQSPMKLKRSFGTPNIPNIIGTNLISFGLAAFSNNVEEARQKAFAMKQMNDPNFNGTFSNADNDYGVDPYVQTGQLRPTFQQGGTFDPIAFLYGDDKEQEAKSEEKVEVKKTNRRITDEDVDNNDFDFMELIYGAGNNRTGSRRKVVNGNAEHGSLTEAIGAGESGNNYFAANPQPGQTAFGKYQFTNDAQKDAYEMSGGKQKYGSFEAYQQLFKTSPQVQEEAMSLRMNQARKVVGDDPVAIALYHYAPKFGLMYKNGELDLDKNPASYGIGKGVANPTFRNYLRTHGFKKYFKEGGEYNVDFDTLRYLQSQGVKFKILD